MSEIKCPMDKPYCKSEMSGVMNCEWRGEDGNCVVHSIVAKLSELADAVGALKRASKPKKAKE